MEAIAVAQEARTEAAATSAQSFTAVQTLLKASLGCITFLRSVTSRLWMTLYSQSSNSSRSIDSSRSNNRNVNGFKIMVTSSRVPHSLSNNHGRAMTRGYTDKADRILNYLEHGIFDASQKQYLRSFIFAIYLVSKIIV
ncbi:hypothetical protein B0H14DRAFT_2694404 [Mycena olivaceomarginata]|nr:hypothetical protein B0H14DRAFT_2694404 [Mycena olivaceomarginata]